MSQHPAHSQNHRHPDEPTLDEIERALKGADFPMTKEKFISLAKNNGADGEILAVLEKMNSRHFDSTDAVLREASRAE
ncbi:hypothetical protein BHUM_03740c [Candidatus Burkholderia humilis]|nr:hypothetical protein BHUM_03740c [Candidatus Burkholderia humilis]